jgi:type VI secretion system secreted protein VgrG
MLWREGSSVMVLDPVRYKLELDNTPGLLWRVQRISLKEGLSSLYRCKILLIQHDPAADPDTLIGSSGHLTIIRGTQVERRVCGIIRRVRHYESDNGRVAADIELVPALMALTLNQNARIFQNLTVPQIVDQVLSAGLQPYQRKARQSLSAQYAQREYCMQYRESDFDFVARLLAREGISFYFDHSGKVEQMVLFDETASLAACNTMTGKPSIDFVPPGAAPEVEVVQSFEHIDKLRPTSVVLHEYDWLQPTLLAHREVHNQDSTGHDREVYEPAPALSLGPGGQSDSAARLRVRGEQESTGEWAGRGSGIVVDFTPGYTFELQGHTDPALDQSYVITQLTHDGTAPDELAREGEPGGEYRNRFVCQPASLPCRPSPLSVAPMPLQTATVVGPASEEIYTDEHGRIKVKFHWDRQSGADEHSSCWIRVAQPWAGPGFGAAFVPRIGTEVVVEYLEGDPDRPLVTGVVYNGRNLLPFNYPSEKTKSGFVTRSSLHGQGGNELVFEDTAGSEVVHLQAAKDWKILVKNDQEEDVRHDSKRHVVGNDDNTIDGNHSETITGTDRVSVKGDRAVNVQGAYDEDVTGATTTHVGGSSALSVQGDRAVSVGGKQDVNVTGDTSDSTSGSRADSTDKDHSATVSGNATLSVSKNRSIDVGGDQSTQVSKKYALDVGDKAQVAVQKNFTIQVSQELTLEVDKSLTLKCGSAKLELKSDGKAKVSGTDISITATGNGKTKGSAIGNN